jgi:hypothetical protein
MKHTLYLLLTFLVLSCSSDNDSNEIENFEFRGYYSGTFTRDGEQNETETGNGTITIIINNEREVQAGYDVVNLSYFVLDGAIDDNGNIELYPTGISVGYAATFEGTVSDETINGTWADSSRNWTGIFTALKIYDVD